MNEKPDPPNKTRNAGLPKEGGRGGGGVGGGPRPPATLSAQDALRPTTTQTNTSPPSIPPGPSCRFPPPQPPARSLYPSNLPQTKTPLPKAHRPQPPKNGIHDNKHRIEHPNLQLLPRGAMPPPGFTPWPGERNAGRTFPPRAGEGAPGPNAPPPRAGGRPPTPPHRPRGGGPPPPPHGDVPGEGGDWGRRAGGLRRAPDHRNSTEHAIIDFSRSGQANGDAVMCVLHSDVVSPVPTR